MPGTTQSYENHAKIRPPFHLMTFIPIVVIMLWALVVLFRAPSQANGILVLLAFYLSVVALWSRIFALGVQDRLIRLEEGLRYERLFPEDMRPRIAELTTEQRIGLRFASDGEVVSLARKVLDEGLSDRKAVKLLVREWRADDERI